MPKSKHKNPRDALKLVRGKEQRNATRLWSEPILNAVLRISDKKQATERLRSLTSSDYWAAHGSERAKSQAELEAIEADAARVLKARDKVWAKMEACPQVLPAAAVRGAETPEGTFNEVRFRDYQLRHKLGLVTLIPVLGCAFAASWLTAHANLVGTELDIFAENVVLGWSMAAIAPTISLGIKAMYSHLKSELARAVYKTALMFGTLASSLAWAVLFALTYKGLGTEVDLGSLFAEPTLLDDAQQTGFVVATLLTEIGVGGVIALRIGQIIDLYAANGDVPNAEYKALKDKWDTLDAAHKALVTRKGEVQGALNSLEHGLEVEQELAQLSHDARRAQNDTPIL